MLCSASAKGDLPEVLFLLQNGADVNGCNKFGRTSLQVVKLGNPDVARALLAAGADPNARDPTCGLTVTHDAAREGFLDMVHVLVEHRADVNAVDFDGNLPLHLAAREGHLKVVQLLLGLTAEPGRRNGHGHTAWDLAHAYHKTDTANYIAEYMIAYH
uniref:Cyclin-dependent kinase inhibitor 2C (p18, inhibits CDK4) n=1 Tax=Myripristis murdjan TaxID=586833 RepID=A0A667WYV2_9TELE